MQQTPVFRAGCVLTLVRQRPFFGRIKNQNGKMALAYSVRHVSTAVPNEQLNTVKSQKQKGVIIILIYRLPQVLRVEAMKMEVIAKPSGFAGNTGFRPHFSRICEQDAHWR